MRTLGLAMFVCAQGRAQAATSTYEPERTGQVTHSPSTRPAEPSTEKAWKILLGFIPFGGIGYEVFKTVTKNDSALVRAAAAKKLAHDPEPDAGEALAKAATDKDWKVRAAAMDAIALREDASLIPRIASAMDDKNDVVRFTAAACVAHLSGRLENPNGASGSKP